MYRLLIVVFVFFCIASVVSEHKSHALTLNDIEPPQYRLFFAELRTLYSQIPTAEITALPETERPTANDLEAMELIISDLENRCQSASSSSSISTINSNLLKSSSKFKQIDKLTDIATQLEADVNQYLTRCYEENDYQLSLNNLRGFIEQNAVNSEITSIVNNTMRCEAGTAQTLINEQKTQVKMYDTTRRYMDQSVNLYNEKSSRYNELEQSVTSISTTSQELGEKSEVIMQRLNFLGTKIKSEQQELELIDTELKRDYQALSQQQTVDGEEVQVALTEGSGNIAFSMDKKHTWYTFSDYNDLFKFLKLLKASNNEVHLIQGKALTVLQKKQTLSELFAEKLANTMVLNLTATEIENNALLIKQYNEEQEQIKPRLDKYKEVAEQRRTQDKIVREELGKLTSAVETCSEQVLEDYTTASKDLDKLNEDVLLEFETQYKEKYSAQEFDDSKRAQSLSVSDPGRLGQITDNYKNLLPRFTNCRQGDQLSIKTSSQNIKATVIKGIDGLSVTIKDREDQSNLVSGIEAKYNSTKPLEQTGINHFVNYFNRELASQSAMLNTIDSSSEIVIQPNIWSQSLSTIQNTYKLYECQESDWREISSSTELTLETDHCRRETVEPITVPINTQVARAHETLTSELNNIIENNQIKVYGSCS